MKEKETNYKIISSNRKARGQYQILETYEAGIALKGNEVKSLRTQGCSLDESFATIDDGQVFIYNLHIPEFLKASYFKPDPTRKRKLLLHKGEINRLMGLTAQKGLTLIPLKLYFNARNLAKLEIGLAKGQKLYDHRKQLKDNALKRDIQRELRELDKDF